MNNLDMEEYIKRVLKDGNDIEVVLTNNKRVTCKKGFRGKGYIAAYTSGDIPLIILGKVPKWAEKGTENNIGEIISHETIHIVLSKIVDEETSVLFDSVCPSHGDLDWLLNGEYLEFNHGVRFRNKVDKCSKG